MNDEKTAADYKNVSGSRRFRSASCSRSERWSFLSGTFSEFFNRETPFNT